MCGIVGYIGNRDAKSIVLAGLKKLEYRGYDSAGIALLANEEILCIKNKGRVKDLENLLDKKVVNGTLGIAHTRWATHGKPSTINSHPHLSNNKQIAVVHNGIIENYLELKEFLIQEGYEFASETDTELIPNLIQYFYLKKDISERNLLNAIKEACEKLVGSYALAIISINDKGKIYVTRKASPLVIGVGENEQYVSSDIPAILSKTNKFYFLDDNDYAIIEKEKIGLFDYKLGPIVKEIKEIDWEADASEKGEFEDYMLKEIFEQPKTIKETIGYRMPANKTTIIDELDFSKEYLESLKNIYIVACGTAMHAGIVGKQIIENLIRVPVQVEVASEFRYKNPIIDSNTLTIFISQSGETADTIAALKLAKEKKAKTVAISNVMGSSITREADYTLYTSAGPEIAVASTKAYTAQIVLLGILAISFAETLEINNLGNIKNDIIELSSKVEEILKNAFEYEKLAKDIKDAKDLFFIGRGTDYAASMEASLKLKEITYIHSESYQAGELKHGPIALIEDGTPVICILTDEQLIEKSISNVQEVISRGAKAILVTDKTINANSNYFKIINIPETNKLISPVLSIIPMQLLSYYIAKEKGLDVDKPRNLAKSVTVE